eukprot:1577250-Rhodomonas_salina.3
MSASHIAHRTSNIAHRTSHIAHRTSHIAHHTSHARGSGPAAIGFDCSTRDVSAGHHRARAQYQASPCGRVYQYPTSRSHASNLTSTWVGPAMPESLAKHVCSWKPDIPQSVPASLDRACQPPRRPSTCFPHLVSGYSQRRERRADEKAIRQVHLRAASGTSEANGKWREDRR